MNQFCTQTSEARILVNTDQLKIIPYSRSTSEPETTWPLSSQSTGNTSHKPGSNCCYETS